MNDAFRQYVFSGLTFRAYAARFGISVSRLLHGITGLSDVPTELADPVEVRQVLRPSLSRALYIAMKGPRGSVRWHHWDVVPSVGLAIMNDEEEFETARKEPGRLYIFPTVDNLIVAINPQHIVTAMFGDEDIRFIVEQKALVPSMLTSGHTHLPENQEQVLQQVHDRLKQVVEEDVAEALSESPGYSDIRLSQAYLRDLKNPCEDHLWASKAAEEILANRETICSQLGSAIHGDDRIYLPTSATVIDGDEMQTHVLLSQDQTSVLQASRWAIERTALERSRLVVVNGAGGMDRDAFVQEVQNGCLALGLFGTDEIDGYVEGFAKALAAHAEELTASPPVDIKEIYEGFIAAGHQHETAAAKTAQRLNRDKCRNPDTQKGMWHVRHVEKALKTG